MGVAAVIMQGLGAAASAVSANMSATANKRIAERNAGVAHMQAADAAQRGMSQGSIKRMEGTQREGAISAAAGASGVDVQSGSVVDTQGSSRMMNEYDVQAIRTNAAREVFGYETQAKDFEYQAALAKRQQWMGPLAAGLGGGAGAISTGYSTGTFKVG